MKNAFRIIILSTLYLQPIMAHAEKTMPAQNYCKLTYVPSSELVDGNTLESELKAIYNSAFQAVYHDYWTPEFEKKQMQFFFDCLEHYKQAHDMVLIVATVDEHIAAWSLFYIQNKNDAVLEVLCIAPAFWRQGLGKKLAFAVREINPAISHIALCSRKINLISPQFYESIGFKKTNLTLPQYAGLDMQGYEWWAE